MAISTNSPEKTTADRPNPTQQPAPDKPNPPNFDQAPTSAAPPSAVPATTTVVPVTPNPTSQPTGVAPPPPQIQSFVPPSQASTVPPSFRPAALPVPLPTAPQFSPIPNPSFQNHGVQGQGQVPIQVQPPGVMMPAAAQYGQPGQQPMRMYAPMPNGYQMPVPQGTMNPPVSY